MAEAAPAAAAVVGPPPVMQLLLPDTEDPGAIMARGGITVTWGSKKDKVKKFVEQPMPRVMNKEMTLPTLYLHFLDSSFRVEDGEYDPGLRAGNDNSEIQLVVPETYTTGTQAPPQELAEHLGIVLHFLKNQAQVMTSKVSSSVAGSGSKQNYTITADPGRWYFSLMTARPKSQINLEKKSFGIPEQCSLYLFAQNHISVNYMTQEERNAFGECILELAEHGDAWRHFSIFLKIFYEGGFAYNEKVDLGSAYLPKLGGVAALGITPAFADQAGIGTGYPYLLKPEFLSFSDTVPVTIGAIAGLSPRHLRYGLCFTRYVYVWEPEGYKDATEKKLNYASILPHGGFFYVPSTLQEFDKLGGLVYAFGEDCESQEKAVPGVEGICDAGHP